MRTAPSSSRGMTPLIKTTPLTSPTVLLSLMKIYSAQLLMWRLKKAFLKNQKLQLWPKAGFEAVVTLQAMRTNVKNAQASLKALEMLSSGALSEKSALAAIGTHQNAYSVAPDVRIKALELVEEGKLSERGLIAILGV